MNSIQSSTTIHPNDLVVIENPEIYRAVEHQTVSHVTLSGVSMGVGNIHWRIYLRLSKAFTVVDSEPPIQSIQLDVNASSIHFKYAHLYNIDGFSIRDKERTWSQAVLNIAPKTYPFSNRALRTAVKSWEVHPIDLSEQENLGSMYYENFTVSAAIKQILVAQKERYLYVHMGPLQSGCASWCLSIIQTLCGHDEPTWLHRDTLEEAVNLIKSRTPSHYDGLWYTTLELYTDTDGNLRVNKQGSDIYDLEIDGWDGTVVDRLRTSLRGKYDT